jgi:YidC/Oxa1 family membrane protein insertase
MLHNIWIILLYQPFVNILAFLVSIIPGGDVGIAIILLTLIVKFALFPLSQRAIVSQAKMTILTPELNKIKASGKNKEEQAKLTFELYKAHKANPFSGCLLVLIQIPIIFALYYVFYKGIHFDGGILYPFIHAPAQGINMMFLGVINIGGKSIFLAVLAGVAQYFQAHFMPQPTSTGAGADSFQDSFSKSMRLQMKYLFPFIVAFIAWRISGAVALYWVTSNMFVVGQQIYAKRMVKHLIEPDVIQVENTVIK